MNQHHPWIADILSISEMVFNSRHLLQIVGENYSWKSGFQSHRTQFMLFLVFLGSICWFTLFYQLWHMVGQLWIIQFFETKKRGGDMLSYCQKELYHHHTLKCRENFKPHLNDISLSDMVLRWGKCHFLYLYCNVHKQPLWVDLHCYKQRAVKQWVMNQKFQAMSPE